MDATILVLGLLACVAVSAILVRSLKLPLPLTQIVIGAAVGAPSFGLHAELEPHLFMLLFVPPLLFADGWRMPKREFFQMRERILALAFGLVLFTVATVGTLLQWMIPTMTAAAAFALAAVLSPTDAVAVSGIAGHAGVPKRLMYMLEGESLMNDASGLTAFNFAIAAAMTGAFSLSRASVAFAFVSLGGLAVGIALGWAMSRFQRWLSGWTDIEVQGTIVLILLLPFAAYGLAEAFGTSGILAAVAAGMTLNLRSAALDPGAEARIASTHIWAMIGYVLNGTIFVLMGMQLPEIIGHAMRDWYSTRGWVGPIWLIAYAIATWLALIGMRVIGVWLLLQVAHLYARWRGRGSAAPQQRLVLAAALAGVRGAITLAAVLSVPLYLEDGSLFPDRSLMIFLAAAVILISLIAASVGLPVLLRGVTVQQDREVREERLARLRACEAAIAAIAAATTRSVGAAVDNEAASPPSRAASQLIDIYQQRLSGLREDRPGDSSGSGLQEAQPRLHLLGLRAERDEILRMHRADEINDTVFNALTYELDVREASLAVGTAAQHG